MLTTGVGTVWQWELMQGMIILNIDSAWVCLVLKGPNLPPFQGISREAKFMTSVWWSTFSPSQPASAFCVFATHSLGNEAVSWDFCS